MAQTGQGQGSNAPHTPAGQQTPQASSSDPGGWAAIGAAYQAANYTFVNGQWVAPVSTAPAERAAP